MTANDPTTALLKGLGQIAGIGGIAFGVFLLIFQGIFGLKKLFPTLTQEHAYKLLRLMVLLCALITVLGIVAYGVGEYRAQIDGREGPPPVSAPTPAPAHGPHDTSVMPNPSRTPTPLTKAPQSRGPVEKSHPQNLSQRPLKSMDEPIAEATHSPSLPSPAQASEGCKEVDEDLWCTKYAFDLRFHRLQTGTDEETWHHELFFATHKKVLIRFTGDITPAEGFDVRDFGFSLALKHSNCDVRRDLCTAFLSPVVLEQVTESGEFGFVNFDLSLVCSGRPCASQNGLLTVSLE